MTIRSKVAEVRINFSAVDQHNNVAAVRPDDFAIVDRDLVVRNFRSFSRSDYARLEIAVLVDVSTSVATEFRQELAGVDQLVNRTTGVPDEGFSVVSFQDAKPTAVCEDNCRSMNAETRFPVAPRGGVTPLYDSIAFASNLLARRGDVHTRKILILFSDGADTISLKSLSDATQSALAQEIAIYSVDLSPQPHSSPGTLVLRGLAANTGGRYFPVEAGLARLLQAVVEDFHATYTVTYKLPNHAAGFHPVRILPTHDLSLQFHCRCGYYYPTNPEE